MENESRVLETSLGRAATPRACSIVGPEHARGLERFASRYEAAGKLGPDSRPFDVGPALVAMPLDALHSALHARERANVVRESDGALDFSAPSIALPHVRFVRRTIDNTHVTPLLPLHPARSPRIRAG